MWLLTKFIKWIKGVIYGSVALTWGTNKCLDLTSFDTEIMFDCHRYSRVVILQAVYFKLRFTLSYRDVKELMSIRGIKVDHSTIQSIKITLIITGATKSSNWIEIHKNRSRVCILFFYIWLWLPQ